ncbi:hypothetical protein H6P81_015241 [Aristolochia fimbriata]|uniref:Uncharacterized protein n=1 Tax=Aristolochia fimbriata TaxID=158543 RepID=A0AAV7E661_ARIFI|nr:hypothetical protein H6P81_015241 [Aristolochia fimbriata]
MKARLVVFPIKGRNWCFSRYADRTARQDATLPNPAWKELWKEIDFKEKKMPENAETVVDFLAIKMNRAWVNLGKAPDGTMKNRIHSLGLRLLSHVKPSENLLKSISKDITKVEIAYPPSLNDRLVRRRLRHVAFRGSVVHKKYFYGSLSLLPFTSVFSVLPLPNIPFFWILFRAYSHWQALKGSERLLLLVSDSSYLKNLKSDGGNGDTESKLSKSSSNHWVLIPSKELEELLFTEDEKSDAVNSSMVSAICEAYGLDKKEVLKYKDLK